ncbi:cytochrome-c peroxidase [Rhodobacteraceae bacterium]|nr:cytochrome-c peroxidase [Paracoccaceae bacterium]
MTKIVQVAALTAAFIGLGTIGHSEDRITKLPPLPEFESAGQEPAMASLGKMLYFDARLSGDGSTSCAECHSPEFGFGDGAELSRGYPSSKHWRNSQTIVNSAFIQNGLHWDASVPSLLHQVPGAMGTPFAHNINAALAEERLRQVPEYVEMFQDIWDKPPELETIALAIAAYERTLISADSPFDRFLSGDIAALSQPAARGLQIFAGKGNCVDCHNGSLATDEEFHNTTVPRNPELFTDPERQITYRTAMRGFNVPAEMYMSFERDPGRYAVTLDEKDLGAFRTPPLRYLKYTAPYMHNGILYTLEEVVEFYDNGGTEDVFGTKSPLIKPLGLTDTEKADLVAFLESMSGTEITVEAPDLPVYGLPSTALATNTDEIAPITSTTANAVGQSGISSSSIGLAIVSGGDLQLNQTEVAGRYIVVGEGETLGQIARREYGEVLKYLEIYQANKDVIPDPNRLTPGTRLLIP